MKKLDVILIGAGIRGRRYTDLMLGERFNVVAVAEPVKELREYIKTTHNIADDLCFESWEPIFEKPKFADVVVIATMDRDHYKPTMKAISLGYDLLLEKPVAPDFKECVDIANLASEMGSKILVCHVLRYSPFFRKIKDVINDNMLGRVISIHHSECVGNLHQSHSFVRGNWGNSQRSSSMILQKTCHDMDIMQWLIGKPCKNVHSFGSLTYFTEENAPKGSPEYCIDGCIYGEECYYNAKKLYLEDEENLWFRGAATKNTNPSNAQVEEAIRTTQYGKCVYKCDNDVVDHQVVNLEFEGGEVASFNMCAFTEGGRFIRVMGTDGEIYGNMETNEIDYYSFKDRKHTVIYANEEIVSGSIVDGHGGGDEGIINVLYDYIVNDYKGDLLSEIEISVKNHLIAFAAEKSRLEGSVVNMADFEKSIGLN